MSPVAEPEVDTRQDLDLSIDVREELDKMPPCESANHDRGVYGHVAAEPAAYLVIAPCGASWMACEGWAVAQPTYATTACHKAVIGPQACESVHNSGEFVLIPLDMNRA